MVKAYHAGNTDNIERFVKGHSYLDKSYHKNNWLGAGVYFWENDSRRAENWQIDKEKGSILECEIDTDNLLNLLEDSDETTHFFKQAKSTSSIIGSNIINNRSAQRFEHDCKIFNLLRGNLEEDFSGIRMAFHLGESVSKDGNLYTGQHIQICLWDLSAILNPVKYIPCRW